MTCQSAVWAGPSEYAVNSNIVTFNPAHTDLNNTKQKPNKYSDMCMHNLSETWFAFTERTAAENHKKWCGNTTNVDATEART